MRFVDAPKDDECQGHLGWGLILKVSLCAGHLQLAKQKGADAAHWTK